MKMARDLPMVTDQDLATFQERGVWYGPKVLHDAEIRELRDAIRRTLEGERDSVNFGWQGPVKCDLESGNLAKMNNSWWVNRTIRRLMRKPAIGFLAAQLLETPEIRVWHDQIAWKPGLGPAGADQQQSNIGWHQDYAHWQCANTQNMITAWIALQDTDESNGAFRVVPGSHKWGLVKDASTFSEKDLDALRCKYERPDHPWIEEPVCLKAGHASFHHALTFHGSGPNLSHAPRLSLIIHLMPQGCGLRADAPAWHLTATLLGPDAQADQPFAGPFFPRLWPPEE